jgi:hypothetical protein
VELDAAQDASGLGGRKGLIEGACGVGRQVILHNADAFGVGIVNIDEFADALGVILGGAPRGDFDLALTRLHQLRGLGDAKVLKS